jgi:CRISPR-associated DxTHG motif protein
MLNHNDQRKFQLRLIPYGVKDNEQVAILLAITRDLPTDDGIILDVTHALRHLPMLGLLSVFYLRAVAKTRIEAIYYGALEQTQDNKTPVLRLDGLLKLYEWIRALENFNKDGDYGAFRSLFNYEKLPGDLLAEAAFLERVANASLGSQKLNTAMGKIDAGAAMSAAGKLFLPLLNQRTEWRKGKDRAQRERRLATDYLGRADYLRAAQFGYESFISAQTRGDLNEYDARKEADAYLSEKAKAHAMESPANFSTLKNLRNALAHGTMDSGQGRSAAFIKKLTGDESELREWLEKALRQT